MKHWHWQVFGDVPQCNTTAPMAIDYYGKPTCPTADCNVLGAGPPTFNVTDPTNPSSGGFQLSFLTIPPRFDSDSEAYSQAGDACARALSSLIVMSLRERARESTRIMITLPVVCRVSFTDT